MHLAAIVFRPAMLATALVAVTAPAIAQTDSESLTHRVSYTSLDLATPAVRAVLDRRIVRAARIVCESNHGLWLSLASAEQTCRSAALRDAREQRDRAVARATTPSNGTVTFAERRWQQVSAGTAPARRPRRASGR